MATCDQVLAHINEYYAAGIGYKPSLETAVSTAVTYWLGGDDHLALYYAIQALSPIKYMLYRLYDANYPSIGEFAVPYYLEHCTGGDPPPEYELTWLKVIESYIAADDDHRSGWQLLVDAYKASMYDKPFDLEYHTMWVKRFKSWA